MRRLAKLLVCCLMLVIPLVTLTPDVSSAKQQKSSEKQEDLVYATKNGKKYHKADCVFIKNRDTVNMSEEEAIAKRLEPCGSCFKEESQEE